MMIKKSCMLLYLECFLAKKFLDWKQVKYKRSNLKDI